MRTPKQLYYEFTDGVNEYDADALEKFLAKIQDEGYRQAVKDIKTSLRSAFEAGMIFEGGAKGNTSLWNDSVSRGFNKYISPILKLSCHVTKKD